MTDITEKIDHPSVWSTIREAVGGSHQDFTEGTLGRAVVLLAIPMVIEMAMESIFAVTDIFFVSKLGAAPVAAVGLTESLLAVVYALAMGLGTAVTAVVSRRIGEKEPDGAAHAAAQGVILGLIVAVVLGTIGSLFAPQLLALMGATPDVLSSGTGFARVMLGGEASVILLFLLNAAFRGAGDAAIAMRVLLVSNAINIVLGPCLIFGVGPFPQLGVTGAAIATTIGRGTGALIAFVALVRGDHRLAVGLRHFTPDFEQMRSLVRLAGSATFQFIIGTASWIGLVRIISIFGSVELAGYTVAIRLLIFALMPAWGLANAAATLVGQNLGAGKPERAEQSVWTACKYNLAFLTTIGVVFVVFAPTLTGFFGNDAAVAQVAAKALRIMSIGFPCYAFGMVVMQAFNGAGDTWTPTWLNFIVFWCWEIPLAWFLAQAMGWGATGGFAAIPIAFSTMAAAGAFLFRRGRWKLQRV